MSHKVLCRFLYLSLWTKFFTKLLVIDNRYFLTGCVLLVWLYLYVIYKHVKHDFGLIVWWYFVLTWIWFYCLVIFCLHIWFDCVMTFCLHMTWFDRLMIFCSYMDLVLLFDGIFLQMASFDCLMIFCSLFLYLCIVPLCINQPWSLLCWQCCDIDYYLVVFKESISLIIYMCWHIYGKSIWTVNMLSSSQKLCFCFSFIIEDFSFHCFISLLLLFIYRRRCTYVHILVWRLLQVIALMILIASLSFLSLLLLFCDKISLKSTKLPLYGHFIQGKFSCEVFRQAKTFNLTSTLFL